MWEEWEYIALIEIYDGLISMYRDKSRFSDKKSQKQTKLIDECIQIIEKLKELLYN